MVFVSYEVDLLPVERWLYWRWTGGSWVSLEGLPVNVGHANSPFQRISTGEELFVTYSSGPFQELVDGRLGCLGVRGVTTTEFGLAVTLEPRCGYEFPTFTLSLIGSGDGAVAVLVDSEGVEWWRSPPGVEAVFERLVAFALAEGPAQIADPSHVFQLGGDQMFWTSTDGVAFHLASVLPASPWPSSPALMGGTVIAVQAEVSVGPYWGGSLIGERSSVRVLVSEDARTWVDSGLEIDLPVGEPIGELAVVATSHRVLVTVSGRTFVGAPGDWLELDVSRPWAIAVMGDHFLAVDGYESETPAIAVSSDAVAWDVLDLTSLVETLGCGTGSGGWRVFGDEVWLVAGDDEEACIIRGRFEPTT